MRRGSLSGATGSISALWESSTRTSVGCVRRPTSSRSSRSTPSSSGSGQRWTGLCPFHAEKSPSFSVNAEEGFYHCFGCKASGDAITFLREKEQLDFVGAVESLAQPCGHHAALHRARRGRGPQAPGPAVRADRAAAAAWYHDRLRTCADAAAAREYLRGRGLRRRRGRPLPDRLGARRLGPDGAVAAASRSARPRGDRAGLPEQGADGCRTSSGPGSCSRSSTSAAGSSASAGASCPTPTVPSTRTRGTTSSTTSRRSSTASTGPRPMRSTTARSSSARATPT